MPSIQITLSDAQLSAFADTLPHAIYLSQGAETANGYTIFTAAPLKTTTKIEDIQLKEQSAKTTKAFTEGWIGCISYGKEVFAGYYQWRYCYDHALRSGDITFNDNISDKLKSKILALIDNVQRTSTPLPHLEQLKWQASQSFESYKRSFEALKNYILSGDCYQANLTQRFETTTTLQQNELFQSFLRQIHSSTARYCAYIEVSPKNTLLSFSPEQFISICRGTVSTKPIKGTVKSSGPLNAAQRNELLSTKNKAENLMIVDLLRNDLSKFSKLNSVKVEKLFDIESYENVHHLVSTVTSELDDSRSPFDTFLSAFPGGSITGAPKKRAMEIIDELEVHPRRYYCGSVFYWDIGGKFDSNILIRTVEHLDDKLYCWGGGGIVADSQLESEYQESLDKVRHITGDLSPQKK